MEGLIHISEISEKRVEHPKEVLKVGDHVALRILRIDEDEHRIGLSLRRVDSAQYADQDWKALAKDLDVSTSSQEETFGDIVGTIPAVEEQPTEEVAESEAVKEESQEVQLAEEEAQTKEAVAESETVQPVDQESQQTEGEAQTDETVDQQLAESGQAQETEDKEEA